MLGHLLLAIGACLPVEGDRILMRDLAAASEGFAGIDQEESIGYSPAPGTQRRFSAGELSRLAARKGVSGSVEAVCFQRKLEPLTKERVLAGLREALPEGAEVELVDFSQGQIPRGAVEFSRSGLLPAPPASPRNPTIWRGRVKYGTAQSVAVWAKVRTWISQPTVVAAQDLQAGKAIQADQIRVERIDAGPFTAAGSATEEIAGMLLLRPVRAGSAIPRTALQPAVEVTRGEMVGVEARSGAALLKFEARAEASGRTGDAIALRNVESGKTFRGRVLRKGWVAVETIE